MKHLFLPIIIACASALATVPSVRANSNPLFQNPLIWIGTPNPVPPPADLLPFTPFTPSPPPEFTTSSFGWMKDFEFEAVVLGLASGSTAPNSPRRDMLAVFVGTLTLTLPDGQKLGVEPGGAVLVDPDNPSNYNRSSITALMKDEFYRAALLAAVETAATQFRTNATGANGGNLMQALAAVVQTVAAADPSAAETIVKLAVDNLTEGGTGSRDTLRAINTVVAATSNGAGTDLNTLYTIAAGAAQENGNESFTPTFLQSPFAAGELGEVFGRNPGDAYVPIDFIIVSPSS